MSCEATYRPVIREDLDAVLVLLRQEGWPSYAEDPETAWKALTAPGVCTLVALNDAKLIGLVQMQSDGHIQAHLSVLIVSPNYRRQGIGRKLIEKAFTLCGGKRIDVLSNDDAVDFYQTFEYQPAPGFRIYPRRSKLNGD
jgi:ribosomal protein S18 acetylase RimI-like enzyme